MVDNNKYNFHFFITQRIHYTMIDKKLKINRMYFIPTLYDGDRKIIKNGW